MASSSPWPWVATTTIECPSASAAENSRLSISAVRQPSASARAASVCAIGERPTMTRRGAGCTGSMNTSSAPSLWQAIGTTVIPSGTVSPNWSGVPRSSRRGSPSAITCRAWRMTTGSAQAPPIQPCTSPSAVMIARLPSWPDDGPCRHTTVASANACPERASSLARSRTPQPSMPLFPVSRPT